MWSEEYSDLVQRNIGLLTQEQQQVLKGSCVAVLGLGGLGGVIAEVLVRCGICSLKIADRDKFDPTNFNRQVFAFKDTVDQWKTDVTEKFLKDINPEVKIEKFNVVTESNIEEILRDVDVALLALDGAEGCLIVSRTAKRLGIPLVEGWALPFGNVRVFTKDTPTLEEVYGLATQNKEISAISEEEYKGIKMQMLSSLKSIKGVENYYPPLAVERIMAGKIPSFAPMVWLTAVLMSLEAVKVLLSWGRLSLAPEFSLYDPFEFAQITSNASGQKDGLQKER